MILFRKCVQFQTYNLPVIRKTVQVHLFKARLKNRPRYELFTWRTLLTKSVRMRPKSLLTQTKVYFRHIVKLESILFICYYTRVHKYPIDFSVSHHDRLTTQNVHTTFIFKRAISNMNFNISGHFPVTIDLSSSSGINMKFITFGMPKFSPTLLKCL